MKKDLGKGKPQGSKSSGSEQIPSCTHIPTSSYSDRFQRHHTTQDQQEGAVEKILKWQRSTACILESFKSLKMLCSHVPSRILVSLWISQSLATMAFTLSLE